MPNEPDQPNILVAGNLALDLNSIEAATQGHLAHALVQSMANPNIVAESTAGRDGFTPAATAAAKRRLENHDDTIKLQHSLGDFGYAVSPEQLADLNRELGNTIVIDENAGKGGGW